MTENAVINHFNDYSTGPVTVVQVLQYDKGFMGFGMSYSFSYRCDELGINWDSRGNILESGFSSDVFTLFDRIGLDADHLRSEMKSLENYVPANKSDRKYYLENYQQGSKEIIVYFRNESWRRDYWFFSANRMYFTLFFKEEVRLLFQLSPGMIMLCLSPDGRIYDETNKNWGSEFRTYEIVNVPGKKGVYQFGNIGFQGEQRLLDISGYTRQFGFGFAQEMIRDALETVKTGYMYKAVLTKRGYDDQQQSQEEDDYDYSDGGKSVEDYLEILGLEPGASRASIKKAYHELSLKFHPDVISGKDLDPAFIEFANERFKQIQEAYDYLKENY